MRDLGYGCLLQFLADPVPPRAGRGAGDDRRRKQLAVNLAVVAAAAAATLNSFGGVPAGDAEDGRSDGWRERGGLQTTSRSATTTAMHCESVPKLVRE